MEKNERIKGLAVYVGGTWAEISDGTGVIFSGSVVENSSPEQIYHAWVKSLEPMWIENAKRGGYYRWFSGFCRIRDIAIDSNGKPWQCEVITSANNIVKAVRLSENPPVTFRALDFDSLYANCKYAYMADVNNGYGCSHPEQEETGSNENGETEGKCYCWSCPLGVEFCPNSEAEDADALKNASNIRWTITFDAEDDEGPDADDIEEGSCLLVNDGLNATADELDAIRRHDSWLTRFSR